MKRIPELRDLSVDHHHGLLLARMAKLVASGQEAKPLPEMWKEVEERFRLELEPHFRVEEEVIAPALESHGEHQLVQRLLREHAALRRLARPGGERTAASLAAFGELLENHIRFEEREMFEVTQAVLSADQLKAIATASGARHG
jgi:hemerythrin